MSHPPLLNLAPYYSPSVAPRSRSRILIPIAVGLVLGAIGVAALLFRAEHYVPDPTISIVEPATLGGRSPRTDPESTAMAADFQKEMAADDDITQAFTRVYSDAEGGDTILAFAFAFELDKPERELFGTLMAFSEEEGLNVRGIDGIGPGPLGGAAKCGVVVSNDSDDEFPVCGWADEGSLGVVLWYDSRLDPAMAEFVTLRGEIESLVP